MRSRVKDSTKIGEKLVLDGMIEERHLQEAIDIHKEEGGTLVATLISLGYLDQRAFDRIESGHLGIPSIQLSQYKVRSQLCALISRDFATRHQLFPVDLLGKMLTVGMVYPLDAVTIRELEDITELKVKAVLCRSDDVETAIHRYYPANGDGHSNAATHQATLEQVESSIRLENVARLVRQIDSLPTLPETVQRVKEAADDDDISVADVVAIIERDPPIAAKLLHLANSAAYGFPNRVDDVNMAIVLLGLKETYLAALSSAIIDYTEHSKHFDHRKFWRNSSFCATATRKVAAACNEPNLSGAFTAGLLLDIGQYALSVTLPARYAKIDKSTGWDKLPEIEESTCGISHTEVGFILATHWRFPPEIAEAIRFHHTPHRAALARTLTAITAVASSLTEANARNARTLEDVAEICGPSAEIVGLDSQEVFELYTNSADEPDFLSGEASSL